jgi:hypothetical protein
MTIHQIAAATDARGEPKPTALAPRRRALVVAGMHRSGTSAFARVFNLLGAELPRTVMSPEDFTGNPTGFWEPLEIVQLHDELLREAGRNWHDFAPIPHSWFQSELVKSYEARLVELVRQQYGTAPFFVVKDPRISRLVPLWLSVLERLDVTPSFAIVLRNPLEVAASLKERDSFGPTKSYVLWLRHVLEVEHDTRGLHRSFVAYDDLMRDWRAVVNRLAEELDLAWPRLTHVTEYRIEQFLSDAQRHHLFSERDLETRADVPSWVKSTYTAASLLVAGAGEETAAVFDAVSTDLGEADRTYGLLVVERELRIQHLVNELRAREAELEQRGNLEQELEQVRLELAARVEDLDRVRGERRERLEELQQAQAERDARARELADAIGERDARAEELERLRAERRDRVEALRQTQAERDARARELAQAVVDRDTHARELAQAVADRDAKAEDLERVRTERRERVEALRRAQEERDAKAAELERALRAKEAEAAELRRASESRDGQLEEARRAAHERTALNQELRAKLAERTERTEQLGRELAERAARAEELGRELAERAARAEELERELAERAAEAEELRSAQSARGTKADELERAVAERDARVAELERAVAERDARVAELEARLEQVTAAMVARSDDAEESRRALAERDAAAEELGRLLGEREAAAEDLARALDERTQVAHARKQEALRFQRELAAREAELASQMDESRGLRRALRTVAEKQAAGRREVERLSAAILERERELAERRQEVGRLGEGLALRQSALERVEADVVELRRRVDAVGQDLRAREQALVEQERETQRLAAELAAKTGTLADRERAVADLTARAGQLDEELRARVADLADRERTLAEQRAEVTRLRGQQRTLSTELQERTERLAALERKAERLADELAGREGALAEREEQLEVLTAAHAQAQEEIQTLRLGALAAEEQIATLSTAHARAQELIEDLRRDAAGLQALLESDRFRSSWYRTLSQLGSWLIRGRFGLVRTYFAIRRNADIDGPSYAVRYPDVALSGLNPVLHYVEHGLQEGRDASPWRRLDAEILQGPQVRELPEAVAAELDAAISDHQPPAPPEPAPVDDERARLLSRIRGVAERNIPVGAKVSIVTGGDASLLNLPEREAWHFPRTPGGAHRGGDPVDSAEVVSWLEQARRSGAEYLLVPSPSLPWLERYRGLADHLERRCRLIVRRDDSCAIYALTAAPAAGRPADGGLGDETAAQTRALIRSLLPAGAGVVVVGGESAPAALDGVRTWRLDPSSTNGPAVERLEQLIAGGARYLFVPASELQGFTANRNLREHVEGRYPVLARRANVGVIFEAAAGGRPAAAKPKPKPST